jgi:hypothetical protein
MRKKYRGYVINAAVVVELKEKVDAFWPAKVSAAVRGVATEPLAALLTSAMR